MADKRLITQAYVRQILHYEPETGAFTWLHRADARKEWNTKFSGKPAGTAKGGYRELCIDNVKHYAHRLAFLYMTGRMPKEIDHENGNPSDNRWVNLRAATHPQNMWNAEKRSDNASGCSGVYWHEQRQAWHASISAGAKRIFLGRFQTMKEAVETRRQAAIKYHSEFARIK